MKISGGPISESDQGGKFYMCAKFHVGIAKCTILATLEAKLYRSAISRRNTHQIFNWVLQALKTNN